MNELNEEARRVTSVELLDAAIWREIDSDDPQPAEAFLQALSCLLWPVAIMRSGAPAMDAVTVLCQARAYVVRHENGGSATRLIKDARQHRDLKIEL